MVKHSEDVNNFFINFSDSSGLHRAKVLPIWIRPSSLLPAEIFTDTSLIDELKSFRGIVEENHVKFLQGFKNRSFAPHLMAYLLSVHPHLKSEHNTAFTNALEKFKTDNDVYYNELKTFLAMKSKHAQEKNNHEFNMSFLNAIQVF